MSRRGRPAVGDVVEIPLAGGLYAYARVYRDASIGIYRKLSLIPQAPPVGSRDFLFFVGIYDSSLRRCAIVGRDEFSVDEDEFPPPQCIRDPISGQYTLYHRGRTRPASATECTGLEEAAVWDLDQIARRIAQTVDIKTIAN